MAKRDHDSARRFFIELGTKPLKHVYLLTGEERHLVTEAMTRITKKVFPSGEPDTFRYQAFEGKGLAAETVINLARTPTMLGGARLIVIKNAERMTSDALKLIAEYANKPYPMTCLALVATKLDKRQAGPKALARAAAYVNFDPLYDNEMAGWVARRAGELGLTIAPGVAEHIADAIGENMAAVNSALQALASGGPTHIDLELARATVEHWRDHSVFELTEALENRDLKGSMTILRRLLEQNESPIGIGALIASMVRRLLMMKEAIDVEFRPPKADIIKRTGVHAFLFDRTLAAAQRFEMGELVNLHRQVFEFDRRMKSTTFPQDAAIQTLVMQICGLPPELSSPVE